MKSLKITLLILVFSLSVFSQAYEVGRPSELKGLKKIYVDTDADLQNRERIIKEINKANLGFIWVDDIGDAEIVILFKSERGNLNAGTVAVTVYSGRFLVFVTTGIKPRLVMSYENEQQTGWEQKPTTKFAKEFIKYYRQADSQKSVPNTNATTKANDNVSEVAGTYTGEWKSDSGWGGSLVLSITIKNGVPEARTVFTGSEYLNEDYLDTTFSSLGAGVWKMEYRGKHSGIQGTGLISGDSVTGDYKFQVSGETDSGKWTLTKKK